MTAPKWGGPWVGKVAAHGHWETPATEEIELQQVSEGVTLTGYYDWATGTTQQNDGFLSEGASIEGSQTGAGALAVAGHFGPIPEGTAGGYIGASLHVTITGVAEGIGGHVYTRASRGVGFYTADDHESPFSGTDNIGVPLGVAQLADVPALVFTVELWAISPTNLAVAGAITAISLAVTYQPPDVWVPD